MKRLAKIWFVILCTALSVSVGLMWLYSYNVKYTLAWRGSSRSGQTVVLKTITFSWESGSLELATTTLTASASNEAPIRLEYGWYDTGWKLIISERHAILRDTVPDGDGSVLRFAGLRYGTLRDPENWYGPYVLMFRSASAPCFLMMGLLSMPFTILSMRTIRRRHRLRRNGCPHCGYDLRATPERCPECGITVKAGAA